ncbi:MULTISPECIES: penicillin-binding transpeptidase domain-containing protein [unclassified Streptomyces]|uniref:penicillin-binding transpeptidase domain-containing protein n=1 Tax=unclassified Streptomyces TaxID=2593676 RepID=UPI0038190ED1
MRRGVKVGIISTVFAGMVGAAGYGAYNVYQGLNGGGGFTAQAAPVETGPPSAAEVEQTAKAFLAAWAKGDTTAAGSLTNDATTARDALAAYRTEAHVTRVKLTPGTPADRVVPFNVVATLSYGGKTSTWKYGSALTVFRGATTHKPLVDWQPSVLYPKLTPGQSLVTGEAASPQVIVVDRAGKTLNAAQLPSLSSVLPQLRERYGSRLSGGKPGIETYVSGPDGPGQTLHTLSAGTPAKLHTTLDAALQATAEKAVKRKPQSSVAAVKASTGEILAFANNPATDNNNAFNAQVAPGSTFKVITATALLEKGVSPGTPAPCPATANYNNGKMFHNVESSSDPSATFQRDFAISCNTGFIKLAGNLSESSVPDVAQRYYGFGQTWNVGVPAWDGRVPGGSGDEMTEEMIGQGQIQMSPLNMAAVAATADTGTFRQPRLVAKDLIGEPLAKAGSSLPYGVRSSLKSMMRLTASSGTAAGAMSGVYGDVGAKTGSAEVGGQEKPNGWFLAYRNDVAAAGMVLEGGHGGDSAGPIVASVLKASS